jgi:septal ring factor EnvC (AmiA/AmiB activator)
VSIKSEATPPTQENLSEKIRAMGTLTAQAQRLGEEQTQHSARAQQLDDQIKQGEVKFGKLMQDFLQLERALELKKKHIAEDKEARERELASYQAKTEQIRSIITRVNAIATDENVGSSTGGLGDSRSQT